MQIYPRGLNPSFLCCFHLMSKTVYTLSISCAEKSLRGITQSFILINHFIISVAITSTIMMSRRLTLVYIFLTITVAL